MAKKDEDKRSGGYTSVRDMFDGGGAGRSGASFEGSPLSTFGNAAGIRPSGSDRPNPQQSVGFRDYFDGGGYGRSGQSFAGSPYSILANALGIKPAGYEDRMRQARPQMRQSQPMGFGTDYSDMLMTGMGLGQTPYGITPQYVAAPTAPSAPLADNVAIGYGGMQIVPTMDSVGVPELNRYMANSDLVSPTAAADRAAYLSYMNTGMYPQGY